MYEIYFESNSHTEVNMVCMESFHACKLPCGCQIENTIIPNLSKVKDNVTLMEMEIKQSKTKGTFLNPQLIQPI